jgi:hypothetical protein
MLRRVPGPTERLDTVATISPYARHGGHHRNRRLAAAGHHVDVHRAAVHVRGEVDGRHAIRADRRGRQVDHQHAERVELARILRVHVGAGGVEGNLDLVGFDVRQQTVDAVGGRLQTHLRGALQAVGRGIDADHPDRLQHRAALEFVEQIGADVAGTDQRASDFFHARVSRFIQ